MATVAPGLGCPPPRGCPRESPRWGLGVLEHGVSGKGAPTQPPFGCPSEVPCFPELSPTPWLTHPFQSDHSP